MTHSVSVPSNLVSDMRRLLLLSLMLLPTASPVWSQAQRDTSPTAVARLTNLDAMYKKLGITSEHLNQQGIDLVKIAVLDFGFDGLDGKRPYLPASTVIVENYDPAFVTRHKLGDPGYTKPFAPGNTHGRAMAQIVWGLTGHRPNGPAPTTWRAP